MSKAQDRGERMPGAIFYRNLLKFFRVTNPGRERATSPHEKRETLTPRERARARARAPYLPTYSASI